jgi:hypothetical protein
MDFSLLRMKPVLKDQLFENPHEGHTAQGEVELEERIDDEIDFPYRAADAAVIHVTANMWKKMSLGVYRVSAN